MSRLAKTALFFFLLCVRITAARAEVSFIDELPAQAKNLFGLSLGLFIALIVSLIFLVKIWKQRDQIKLLTRELHHSSLKDSLTGLYNYRYFQERLNAELKRAKRSLESLTLLFIDLDRFKATNDTYGFAFGDHVLHECAALLKKSVRENDIVFKYRDAGFGIILPTTGARQAQVLADRLLEAIHRATYRHDLYATRVRASIGLVSFPDDGIVSRDELIACAHEALMKAKELGGGQSVPYAQIYKRSLKDLSSRSSDEQDVEIIKDKVSKLNRRLNQTCLDAVNALSAAVEAKDYYTIKHSEEVTRYVLRLAAKLKMDEERTEVIKIAAILHDIGKIGISERILLKPGGLNAEEYEMIKMHPIIGAEIIKCARFLEKQLPIIRHHHENWDGSGYPDGLKGQEIPLESRIVALADMYAALIAARSYRDAYLPDVALAKLREERGKRFDPHLTDLFIEAVEEEIRQTP